MTLQNQKAKVLALLQTAFEVELSTIPPYLTALLSMKKQKNRIAANLIRSVFMEEMLHMTLVGNLISSLGGKVCLQKQNIPTYPLRLEFEGKRFKDREFDVNLEAFSPQAISIFKQIEMPASLISKTSEQDETPEVKIPGITIGEFYKQIMELLEKMCSKFPESEVFCGNTDVQINERYYWAGGGKPILIHSLETALEALNVIIKQGEGSHDSIFDGDETYFEQPDEIAHYFRFNEIACGRYYQVGDKPKDPPSGEHFEVDYDAVFPIKCNAKSSDYPVGSRLATLNDEFNGQYSLMLFQLAKAFNGNPSVLYDAIINGMHNMTSIAHEMMSLPIADSDKVNGAPSFEWIEPIVEI